MKMKLFPSTSICLILLVFNSPCHAQRAFTSSDGKTLLAEIVKASATDVTLKRANDRKEFTIPLKRLSELDQKFISDWSAKKQVNQRAPKKITLSLADGKTQTMEIPEGAYLSDDGTLTIYPGETIHLEFDEKGKPQVVSEVKLPKRTVTFSMVQDEQITMVTRKTQMQETVAMDCTHRSLDSEKFSRTNLRPTVKGLASFDSWPSNVWTVRLNNFEVTNRPAEEVYEERSSQ